MSIPDEFEIKSLSQEEWLEQNIFNRFEVDYPSLLRGFYLPAPVSVESAFPFELNQVFFAAEKDAALSYKIICEQFAAYLHLDSDVEQILTEAGKMGVRSERLTNYWLANADLQKLAGFEPESYFQSADRISHSEKLSFLIGTYIRFNRFGELVLMQGTANYVVLDLIRSYCTSSDTLTAEFSFHVPDSVRVKLKDGAILTRFLKQQANRYSGSEIKSASV